MKYLQYDVVYGFSIESLISEVQAKLDEGWAPLGGMQTSGGGGYLGSLTGERMYFQTLTKRESDELDI